MDLNIWSKCRGDKHITSLKETPWRIVETQNITSTRKLVDSLNEQEILEELIETVKPAIPVTCKDLHPLLYTSYRYPPLKHGSRFANRYDYSLWYGSLELETALTEKAFYQFNFLRASAAEFDIVEVPLTAFTVHIKTERAVNLTNVPFNNYRQMISSPVSYDASQALGAAMRKRNIEAFCYQSARGPQTGKNLGVFTPNAFWHKHPDPHSFQSWQCIANSNMIEFVRSNAISTDSYSFPLSLFLVDGELPFPSK